MTDLPSTNYGSSHGPPLPQLAAAIPLLPPLVKHCSWSPDSDREESWVRRKNIHKDRRRAGRLSRSVTDEDLDELRGCIDLGFVFEVDVDGLGSGSSSARLVDTFPALDLYFSVHRPCSESVAGERSSPSDYSSSPGSSPLSIYSPGDSPHQVKARLKQWAQVVACSVRQRR